jgi:hypothetical protein
MRRQLALLVFTALASLLAVPHPAWGQTDFQPVLITGPLGNSRPAGDSNVVPFQIRYGFILTRPGDHHGSYESLEYSYDLAVVTLTYRRDAREFAHCAWLLARRLEQVVNGRTLLAWWQPGNARNGRPPANIFPPAIWHFDFAADDQRPYLGWPLPTLDTLAAALPIRDLNSD